MTKHTITAMRDWLKDCVWGNVDEEFFDDLSDKSIMKGVARYYEGGVVQFMRDGEAVRS